MLKINIPDVEVFDEINQIFKKIKGQEIQLEHSLVSLAKWESKWKKPFINPDKTKTKSLEETIDYIRCMTLTQNVNSVLYNFIPDSEIVKVNNYINDSMTATTFSNEKTKANNREIMTAEVIYYYMVALNIPFECQKWHLNRLLTLIKVCSIKNAPPKKMSKKEILSRNAALNAARRRAQHTKG